MYFQIHKCEYRKIIISLIVISECLILMLVNNCINLQQSPANCAFEMSRHYKIQILHIRGEMNK